MFKEKIKEVGKNEKNNKKKIENIVFLIVVLVITIIIINVIMKDDNKVSNDEKKESNSYKTLAGASNENENNSSDLKKGLEKILSTIKGVGEVDVFINYSESSVNKAMYDETTTTSTTEETDSSGGVRNVTSTETQKEVIYSEEDGDKKPMTEKVVMPSIEGAIITAQGASNATIKTNIVNAVQAATGLTIDKIQVFEMNKK